MSAVEYACVFARAEGGRLLSAERFVVGVPGLLGPSLRECDLAFRVPSRFLALVVRFAPGTLDAAARDRIAFWTARSGGRASALGGMSVSELHAFRAQLASCDLRVGGIPPGTLFEEAGRFFTDAGAPADRPRSAADRPVLAMDVGGPGWEGTAYAQVERTLFVAAPLGPPLGEEIPLSFRIPGGERPISARGIVLEARSADRAGPGQPAGYAIGIWSPPAELHAALVKHAPAADEDRSRAAPRFRVTAPVRIVPRAVPGAHAVAHPAPEAAPAPPAPRAVIEYATEQELAADFVENLSHGGAFVRTARPSPVGAPVELELRLPDGADLHAHATVVFANANGMGLRFELDAENDAVLSNAIAQISGRPRRALLVDDDALARRMLSDALSARGFQVVTASDGASGLETLAEELLTLDLLVTDVRMPGMDGETFVRTIRKAGGESDLAIVAVTGRLDEATERRLEAAGADAVLDKALGPELVARAADAAVERKRAGSQG